MDPVYLADLIDRARGYEMSEEERELQRIDFAYGNAHLENPNVTYEMVVEACERLKQK